MDETVKGIFDYVVRHEDIDHEVNSTFVASLDQPFLIDPMKPDVDASWFEGRESKHVFMTNRLHDRGIQWFVETFGCTVWCHESGLHEFEEMDLVVKGFQHGDNLPCGVEALEVGVLCPEETAFLIPAANGVLAIGDAFMRYGELGFVPDEYIGDDPEAVKRGLVANLRLHLERDFDAIVMAHGAPIVENGKAMLREFLDGTGH
jgi:hypothetical protein